MRLNTITPEIRQLRELIDRSRQIVLFTGAGISTESGVSDYRSKGGIWQRFQPVTIQEFLASRERRGEYWREKRETYGQMRLAKPSPGHLAMARLEKKGKVLGLITQNIDGLHQVAGSKKVLELHGTNREVICLDCKRIGPFDPIYEKLLRGEEEFICEACGGLLKPNTISFGQALDPDVLEGAMTWAKNADLFIAAGSTLIVEPAASLPRLAKGAGAHLIIINRDPTPLDSVAELVVHTTIGPFLAEVVGEG